MRFKEDPDFAEQSRIAHETAERELRLMLERIALAADEEALENVYSASVWQGYKPYALKKLVKVRREDPDRIQHEESDLELYKRFVRRA